MHKLHVLKSWAFWNRRLFGGSLRLPDKIVFTDSDNWGMAEQLPGGRWVLHLDKNLPVALFEEILTHEMLHFWEYKRGIKGPLHGSWFMNHKRRFAKHGLRLEKTY